jgi:glycosyltransferase involved in cell wall biosynthesis
LELYADLDIIALTSLNEGTPLTLIEAMCAGCPVASTEVGGVADIMGPPGAVCDGFRTWAHGVTAPSRDISGFARAVTYLIEQPELRRAMGERGRAFVRAEHSRERLLATTRALYEDLLAGDLSPAAAVAGSRG